MTLRVTLSAAKMGPSATEADFDAWASYVNDHIEEATGLDIDIDQFDFTGPNAGSEDLIRASGEDWDAIHHWLSNDGWEEFCADSLPKEST